ncbi:MAG: leucyl/phenylalanyl-tRNA--protein transferase, partial [Dokdonella sp.]
MRLPFLDSSLSEGDEPAFPPVAQATANPNGLLAAGGDLSPQRLLAAYRRGIFPWYSPGEPILWWSPDPRTVFLTDCMHVPLRFKRWLRSCSWTLRADSAFEAVIRASAAPREEHGGTWLDAHMIAAYCRLHDLGHAHCVEVWDGDELVGGIYGVAIGRMFFAESMFSRRTNASKVALFALSRTLALWGFPMLDAQVRSQHLLTLGAADMPRIVFCRCVA